MRGSPNTIEELLARYIPEPNSGCWLSESIGSHGYGKASYQGKTYRLHRLSYKVHHGPIPDGLDVLHKCDTPACINPDHLFLGDDLTNARDKIAKGRHYVQRRVEFCCRGHAMTPENSRFYRRKNGVLMRTCRQCKRLYEAQRYALRKAT